MTKSSQIFAATVWTRVAARVVRFTNSHCKTLQQTLVLAGNGPFSREGPAVGFGALPKGMLEKVVGKAKSVLLSHSVCVYWKRIPFVIILCKLFTVNYSFFNVIHCNSFVTFLGNIPKLCFDVMNQKSNLLSHRTDIQYTKAAFPTKCFFPWWTQDRFCVPTMFRTLKCRGRLFTRSLGVILSLSQYLGNKRGNWS